MTRKHFYCHYLLIAIFFNLWMPCIIIATENREVKNVVSAGTFFPFSYRSNVDYQFALANQFTMGLSLMFDNIIRQNHLKASSENNTAPINLSEIAYAAFFTARYWFTQKYSEWYLGLLAGRFRANYSVSGFSCNECTYPTALMTGTQSVSGFTGGIEGGYAFRFDNFVLLVGLGITPGERRDLVFQENRNGVVQDFVIIVKETSYSFAPRVLINAGYAF